MKKFSIRLPDYQTWLVVIISSAIALCCWVGISGLNEVARQNTIRVEYHRLRSGILYTNLRIRDAALAGEALEQQIHRIDPVRKESLEALEYFRINKHKFDNDQRVIVENILQERLKYRDVQAGVLTLIRDTKCWKNRDRECSEALWSKLIEYDLHMVAYLDKCDSLIRMSNVAADRATERTISAIQVTGGSAVLLIMAIILGHIRWRLKHPEIPVNYMEVGGQYANTDRAGVAKESDGVRGGEKPVERTRETIADEVICNKTAGHVCNSSVYPETRRDIKPMPRVQRGDE